MELAVDIATDGHGAFLKDMYSVVAVMSEDGHTTGWTFDSSCSTSRAYWCLKSAKLPRAIASICW